MTDESIVESNEGRVFHIAEPDVWPSNSSYYKPDAFDREGFVHLSTRAQVLLTAQRYYAGRSDLVLLEIDSAALANELVYENLLGGDELFPHYYAEIPVSAVVQAADLVLGEDGGFSCEIL